MKTALILATLAVALGAAPAQADTGNWISYLKVNGCQCDIGSFSTAATKYTVDPNGPQGTLGLSKPQVTVSTGNQTQNVQVAFTANGVPVPSTSTSSGQQSGVYYTSSTIDLTPGLNLIAITASDPSSRTSPTVVTVAIPYRPVVLTNTAPPALSDSPTAGKQLACSAGEWTADPAPTFIASVESSTDGVTWSKAGRTVTVQASDAGRLFRCKVVADSGYATQTVYSAPVAAGAVAPPVLVAPTVVAPASSGSTSSASTPRVTGSPTGTALAPAAVVTATKSAAAKSATAPTKYLRVHKPTKPVVVHRYVA